MSVKPTTRAYGRAYAWSLVIGFTAASVILNGAHAVLGMDGRSGLERALAATVAVVAPLSLLLATELVVRLIRDWSRRRRWVTWLRGICAGTTVAIALIAFATSFVALMDMAGLMGVTPGLTWTLPAVVDAMIIIATLAVVVAEAEITLDRAEAAEAARVAEEQAATQAAAQAELEAQRATEVAPVVSVSEVVTDQGDRAADHVTDQAADHAVTSSALMVTDQADQSTDHGPLVVTDHADHVTDQAVTTVLHLVSDQTDHVTDHRPVPVSPQVNGHDQAADQGPAVVTDQETDHGDHPGTTAPEVVSDQPTEHRDHTADHVTDQAVTTAPEVVSDHADHVADQAAEHSSDHADHTVTTDPPDGWAAALGADAEGLSELGAMVRADLGTETSAEDITRALEMVQAGTSRRAVAEAVGVGSHNTIRRWVEAASRLDAGYAAAVG